MSLDPDLIARARASLYAPVVSDVLDSLGLMNQAMRPEMRPLDETLKIFGPARTGLYLETCHLEPGENPYRVEIDLVDDLGPGEVAVLACGASRRIAPWGELLTTAARARGAAGCVTDGLVRDIRRIRELGFPVFHGGIAPLDSKGRGKMVARDVTVECGGARVAPGDWIIGDADGVVVVPRERAGEVIALALEKIDGEDAVRRSLEGGESLNDVFNRHKIL